MAFAPKLNRIVVMERKFAALLTLLAFLVAANTTEERSDSSNVRSAIEFVKKPGTGYDNMGDELQVYYRIRGAADFAKYKFKDPDANAWKTLLQDTKPSVYARLCAAYFLLNDDKEAWSFVEEKLRSENLRYRFNAARVVEMFAYRSSGASREWAVKRLIQLLEDRSLEGVQWESSQNGEFPEGDWMDINLSPIDQICTRLGFLKEKRAVPVLVSLIKRRVNAVDAADALGDIGDPQVGPDLVELLNSQERLMNEHLVVEAIAKLKYQPGAAVLAARLQATPAPGWYTIDVILDALLEIGDRNVIPNIEKYSQSDIPNETRSTAKRVLIQLKERDPIPKLLSMLEEESDVSCKAHIIQDLAHYKHPAIVPKLADIAETSDSAFLRRNAISSLKTVGNRQALLALAGLLDTEFPTKLKAEHGWKFAPNDWPKYFHELLADCLKQATKQEFGADSRKWREWIEANIKE